MFVDLLFALAVALILALAFIPLTGPQRVREGTSAAAVYVFFFLILLFATWAGGLWMTPIGPPVGGAYWVPFALVGVLVALLLAAAVEPTRRHHLRNLRSDPESSERTAVGARLASGILFWILLIALIVTVLAGYTFVN